MEFRFWLEKTAVLSNIQGYKLLHLNNIKFVYGKPALIANSYGHRCMAIGDLHIGYENRLLKKGIHIYNNMDIMASSILKMSEDYGIHRLILLGDVKDSIMRPGRYELESLKRFFDLLSPLDLSVVNGNHDSFLSEITGIDTVDELLSGDFAFLHGNRFPSLKAMGKKVIITAHNHIAVEINEGHKNFYKEKAWLISSINRNNAKKFYDEFSASKLIVMPAFNPFIIGSAVNFESGKDKKNINPLFSNGIFDYNKSYVYSLNGIKLGTVSQLIAKNSM